jgi:hypothetical protein
MDEVNTELRFDEIGGVKNEYGLVNGGYIGTGRGFRSVKHDVARTKVKNDMNGGRKAMIVE